MSRIDAIRQRITNHAQASTWDKIADRLLADEGLKIDLADHIIAYSDTCLASTHPHSCKHSVESQLANITRVIGDAANHKRGFERAYAAAIMAKFNVTPKE